MNSGYPSSGWHKSEGFDDLAGVPTGAELRAAAEQVVSELGHSGVDTAYWNVDPAAVAEVWAPVNVYSGLRDGLGYGQWNNPVYVWAHNWLYKWARDRMLNHFEARYREELAQYTTEWIAESTIFTRRAIRRELAEMATAQRVKAAVNEKADHFVAYLRPILYAEAQSIRNERVRASDGTTEWVPAGAKPTEVASITPRQAEELAVQWMRYLGVPDAMATPATRDGGVDVVSKQFVVQVKHQVSPVSPAPVRQIFGVAAAAGKAAVFFALGGYSLAAVDFAESAGVALFVYTSDGSASLQPVGELAKRALAVGLERAFDRTR